MGTVKGPLLRRSLEAPGLEKSRPSPTAIHFCKSGFVGTQPRPFIYYLWLSHAAAAVLYNCNRLTKKNLKYLPSGP